MYLGLFLLVAQLDYSFSPDNKEIMNSNVLGIPKQSEDLLYFEQHCHSVQDNFV